MEKNRVPNYPYYIIPLNLVILSFNMKFLN